MQNNLYFQGIILKVPEKASEAVPIRLQCERRDLECNKEDSEFFEQTWQKIQEVVEASNERKKSTDQYSIKYLQSFTYVLKTVLEHDSCLFSEEEMEFLGVISILRASFPGSSELWVSLIHVRFYLLTMSTI